MGVLPAQRGLVDRCLWTSSDLSARICAHLDISGPIQTYPDLSARIWTSLDLSLHMRTYLDLLGLSGPAWTTLGQSGWDHTWNPTAHVRNRPTLLVGHSPAHVGTLWGNPLVGGLGCTAPACRHVLAGKFTCACGYNMGHMWNLCME
jgi:hypothetical protein